MAGKFTRERGMEIGSLIRIALNAGAEKLILEETPLRAGDLLRLKVIDVREDNRALVDFGKFRALAEVAFPVSAGDELTVKVIDTQGQLRLSLVPAGAETAPTPAAAEPVRPFAAQSLTQLRQQLELVAEVIARTPGQAASVAIRSAIEDLRLFLAPLQTDAGAAQTTPRVQSLCEDSGIFFEKRLEIALSRAIAEGEAAGPPPADHPQVRRILAEDLKARLSAIKHLFESQAADLPAAGLRAAAAFVTSADGLLTEIVRQQERIAARRDETEAFQVIHFSLPLKDAGEGARLKIGYPSRRQGATREGFRAALLLALDRLGPTRIDLFMLERSLSLTFFVTSRTAQATVEAHAGDLKPALETLFDNVSVSVRVSEQKIADFEYEDQLPAGGRRLDVRA
jgi:hypothetical protein